MNPKTNELRHLELGENPPEGFSKVPQMHQEEAQELLGDQDSVIVEKGSGPLANWAQRVRRNQIKGKSKQNE